jgi:hypothetical protein
MNRNIVTFQTLTEGRERSCTTECIQLSKKSERLKEQFLQPTQMEDRRGAVSPTCPDGGQKRSSFSSLPRWKMEGEQFLQPAQMEDGRGTVSPAYPDGGQKRSSFSSLPRWKMEGEQFLQPTQMEDGRGAVSPACPDGRWKGSSCCGVNYLAQGKIFPPCRQEEHSTLTPETGMLEACSSLFLVWSCMRYLLRELMPKINTGCCLYISHMDFSACVISKGPGPAPGEQCYSSFSRGLQIKWSYLAKQNGLQTCFPLTVWPGKIQGNHFNPETFPD